MSMAAEVLRKSTSSIFTDVGSLYMTKVHTMNEKPSPTDNTPHDNYQDSSDSYWLACIAQRQSQQKAAIPPSVEVAPQEAASAVVVVSVETRAPEIKKYPPSPADSFWLKHTEALHQDHARRSESSRGTVTTQMDARVSIPAGVAYSVIIDDGHRHHVVWGIRNMSLSGVLLDMDVSHVREASAVDFLLRYKHKGRAHDYRIPAKVVRTQLNGLALHFNYHHTAIYNALVSLLYTP